jgi:hypothetical protein
MVSHVNDMLQVGHWVTYGMCCRHARRHTHCTARRSRCILSLISLSLHLSVGHKHPNTHKHTNLHPEILSYRTTACTARSLQTADRSTNLLCLCRRRQLPIMLPIACRRVASRYLALALGQVSCSLYRAVSKQQLS